MELQTRKPNKGFTLVELMVVVAIGTILLAIAVPSYFQYVRQSRRTQAKTALLDLAGREESYYATNGSIYVGTATNLGYAGFGAANPVGDGGYYYLTVCVPAAAACGGLAFATVPAAPSYQLVALPTPGTTQVNDTQCAAFGVDSTGQQTAANSAGAVNTQYCWSN